MRPENIGQTMRQFIPMGMPQMIEGFLDKVDMAVDGPHLLQAAIYSKQAEIAQLFISKGVDLTNPPNKVPPLTSDPSCHLNYRQAPFIIQAACAGDLAVMKALVAAGCSLTEVGHICLSKRRQNSVASNVVGAAAYWGNKEVLKYVLNRLDADFVDVKAIECADRTLSKSGPFKPEMHDFTPLQLALVSPHQSVDVVKLLFGKDANHGVKEAGTNNNILHLAAKHCVDTAVL